MKTVLITGAAGFIGSHLCDKLLERGYKVIGLDNLITGDLDNIKHLHKNNKFSFLEYDINNKLDFFQFDINYILNFASPASPIDYIKKPIETLLVGSTGVKNICDLALLKNARVIQASTSEVYGDPSIHPQPETYNGNVSCTGPRSVYDESKRFAEAMLFAYHRTYGMDLGIVRIFNTYGPRMRLDDGRAVPEFIVSALKNRDLTLFGDGLQTRSLCYIDDLVNGIILLMESNHTGPVNIGNPEEISMLDLANEIKNLLNSSSIVTFKPLMKDDPLKRKPDISQAKAILGWEPMIYRKNGLEITIEHFKHKLNEL